MAKRATVPKFGTWDSDNVGYTVYFDKVRENKGATAPPLHRPHNPNDPAEGPMMAVGGHRERPSGHGHHRRAGSSGSAGPDPAGRGAEQSKFAPPPQYHQRPARPQHHYAGHHQQHPQHHHGGHHQQQHAPPSGHGGGHRASQAPRNHHHAAPAPPARSASPQNDAPGRPRPSTVPKFGVWDEQTAASAAQGFTVQFENVKRHRDVARAAVPEVPRATPPPPEPRRSHRDPFLSKMFGCFHPTVRD